MKRQRPPLKDIMPVTGLSRATIDRVLNAREGVRAGTEAEVRASIESLTRAGAQTVLAPRPGRRKRSFKIIIQADEEFTQSVVEPTAELAPHFAEKGCQLEVIPCVGISGEWVAQVIVDHESADGVAILAENSFSVDKYQRRGQVVG